MVECKNKNWDEGWVVKWVSKINKMLFEDAIYIYIYIYIFIYLASPNANALTRYNKSH